MSFPRNLGLLLLASLALIGCQSDDTDGDWDDNIKLSERTVEFASESDSIVITTEGEGWWIAGFSFTGASDYLNEQSILGEFLLEQEHFVLERRNPTTLYIEFDANQTSSPQTLVIQLQNGNYFDSITVTQPPKQM